jgi:Zn-dependent metalloprotease
VGASAVDGTQIAAWRRLAGTSTSSNCELRSDFQQKGRIFMRKPASKKKGTVVTASRGSGAATKRTQSGNGMATFSMSAFDKATAPMIGTLMKERDTRSSFALTKPTEVAQLDSETVASRYLEQALQSKAVPSFTAPKVDDVESEFKSVGTESVPLTGTKTVKFRQTLNKIPVYGSLVTVELDDDNNLVSIGSSLGKPADVDPVARIAAAAAVKAVDKYPGYRKRLDGIVPRLNYYFDQAGSKWRLVYIFEDVPVSSSAAKKDETHIAPRFMDYVVDARSGKVVAELPRTSSMASVADNGIDGLGNPRQFQVEISGNKKTLHDAALNIQTFDFNFGDPEVEEGALPGKAITSPPPWPPSAVSAHSNAASVAQFLRDVLRRNNIDNNGGPMKSSINCTVARESEDGRQWFNAFWNSKQMVYGQRLNGNTLMSLSVDLDVVGHEMFHGVTETTARLEYVTQSGALNESISDIFGIIIANFSVPDPRNWNWRVGEGLSPDGKPFRDMSNPTLFGQPDHMKHFKVLPVTQGGDYGGVHTNSGIHNRAAFNILTAVDAARNLVLNPREVAAVFYLSLSQQLSRTSQFRDSRRGALTSARSLFRALAPGEQDKKLDAITKGFDAVGIT